ncbi:uncharacterized protein LOC134282786 isoform X2 [Saccostrea cucullata]|uniref:uncharacterized protein LOC134282786 isoform X2 n=1 Tax=Saccostrea cuccullata TaxID=36930 RepID=UPI002ED07F40
MPDWRKFGTISLMTISICLFLLGIISLVLGILLSAGTLANPEIGPVINSISVGSDKLGDQISILPILLIAIGVATLPGAVLGILTAIIVKGRKILLIVVSVLSFVVCVGSVVILVVFIPRIQEMNKDQMLKSLQENFTDVSINSTNELSNSWNKMFLNMKLDCCGVNPVNGTTNDFDKTPWCTTKGECQKTNAEIPKTCCLNVTEETYSTAPDKCYSQVIRGTYKTKGCFHAIVVQLSVYSSHILGVLIPILILEMPCGIISVVLCLKKDFLTPQGASFKEICCSCFKCKHEDIQDKEEDTKEEKVPLN